MTCLVYINKAIKNNQKVLIRDVKCSNWCLSCGKIAVGSKGKWIGEWRSPRQGGQIRGRCASNLSDRWAAESVREMKR